MYGHCLSDINDILRDNNCSLKDMDGFKDLFPVGDTRSNTTNERHVHSLERMHARLIQVAQSSPDPYLLSFNDDQRLVFNEIRGSIEMEDIIAPTEPRVFFVDGPGGTGKTFLFNALLDSVRRVGDVAISVASSGTAALLLHGGCTAHSTFKIPIDIKPKSMCNISPRSDISQF